MVIHKVYKNPNISVVVRSSDFCVGSEFFRDTAYCPSNLFAGRFFVGTKTPDILAQVRMPGVFQSKGISKMLYAVFFQSSGSFSCLNGPIDSFPLGHWWTGYPIINQDQGMAKFWE